MSAPDDATIVLVKAVGRAMMPADLAMASPHR
jgi:hypothetical protein